MDPSEWGPGGWKFLHSITFAQPKKPNKFLQKHLRQFFESLGYLLPCSKCAKHFVEFSEKNPIPVANRDELCKWLVDAHNNANRENRERLPVSIPEFSYEQAVEMYAYDDDMINTFEPICKPKKIDLLVIIVVVIAAIAVVATVCGLILRFSCYGSRCMI